MGDCASKLTLLSRVLLTSLAAFVCCVSGVFASETLHPELKDDQALVSFLYDVAQKHPEFFRDAAVHDHDLFEILEDQQKLNAILPKIEEYDAIKRYHQRIRVIHIRLDRTQFIKSETLDPRVIPDWKHALLDTLGVVEQKSQSVEGALHETISGFVPPKNIALGLIKTLAPDSKTLLQAPFDEKVEFLRNQLEGKHDAPLPPGFRLSVLGVAKSEMKSPISRHEVWEVFERQIRTEASLSVLGELYVLLQNRQGEFPKTFEEAKSKIGSIGEGHIDVFVHNDGQLLVSRLAKIKGARKRLIKSAVGGAYQTDAGYDPTNRRITAR